MYMLYPCDEEDCFALLETSRAVSVEVIMLKPVLLAFLRPILPAGRWTFSCLRASVFMVDTDGKRLLRCVDRLDVARRMLRVATTTSRLYLSEARICCTVFIYYV
ncbi:hypothetical protein LSTR_LSTR016256 [Laodelphax striatellus]|uniref:Uncharacterized protein n=1 Tax=Laodelphax striatellus TaxID=195883 RepID=A0A482XHZ7_LAOST|nr:hypothetical protein LSTR_LSTR016256 [Laodelphax striatellus]